MNVVVGCGCVCGENKVGVGKGNGVAQPCELVFGSRMRIGQRVSAKTAFEVKIEKWK